MVTCHISVCCFYVSCNHLDLPVLTHPFPTRRSSDLVSPLCTEELRRPAAPLQGGRPAAHSRYNRLRRLLGRRGCVCYVRVVIRGAGSGPGDRKSTRLNSSH